MYDMVAFSVFFFFSFCLFLYFCAADE